MTATTKSLDRGTSPVLALPATLVVAGMIFLPILVLFRFSFNIYDRYDMMVAAFTLENYIEILSDPFFRDVLFRTVIVAITSTLIALILSFPIAYGIARAPSRFKNILILFVIFPLLVGNVVRAAGWMALLGTAGFVNRSLQGLHLIEQPLEMLNTPGAVVLGIVSIVIPFMVLTLQSVIDGIDTSLEEAAGNLGASPFVVFHRVVFPLALPGVAAATVLVFILCMNSYATPVLLGGPRFHVMAPQVFQQITGQLNWPFGAALAFVLMAVTLLLTVISTLFLNRQSRAGR